jgi:prevent-host-death family protein
MHEAKTHLSRLVDRTAKGEPFIIAKAGKPLVKVVSIDDPPPVMPKRFDFLAGRLRSRTILTRCSPQKSRRNSTAKNEAAARYASPALDN